MELYPVLKSAHMGLAVASIVWFVLRGSIVIHTGRRAGYRALRVAPHVVDTLLLVSGVWVALKPWCARPWRWSLMVMACAVFGWMLTVAVSKSPWGPLSQLGW
jgi:uncharacterized membrane protein SirB2